ncbi:DoxX subfamily protein [Nitratireductor indicus C115]|uniref:DoxX subfamily protein n=1 Tax=Nitratireductor indicus C115 TaxID=1231190 RepID=K2PMW2_9HYPH|nr:DoxX family protein [Nitratireductor indicus]EKF42422.1 DoxX subfamily protein [Nitratireductor indicus C115]SFQ55821.1 putative oxidoreductase [Nitratireductor indicus]
MTGFVSTLVRLYATVFASLERAVEGWLPGLAARFSFLAVLYFYFLNSALTKVEPGIAGFFHIADGAYYQIALPAVEAAGRDVSQVAFLPWGLIVRTGTYAEFILPILVVLGLFTRLAALGMIGFVLVQSYVDITVHQVGKETAGAWFDRFSDGLIFDQRTLWVFLLLYLAVKGAGALSLDAALARIWTGSRKKPLALA